MLEPESDSEVIRPGPSTLGTGSMTARFERFASTTGRAVSRRSEVGWSVSGLCPRRQDTLRG